MSNQTLTSIATLNTFSQAQFVEAFGDVAEHTPWVAQEAFKAAPFQDRCAVIKAFETAMRAAPRDCQLALIRAHPDLAGKAALAGEIADDSKREQAGVGLDTLTPAEFSVFNDLNTRYLERFGFPFIFAVKGADKHMILNGFDQRISNTPEVEFETALTQITRIIRFRLEDRIC
ncbi:2-oxo-4-hydroxy-4-carboxy-5-ureidoimidazoline decarboxylase [Roseibium algae]|uniref:2-oxo-4-hydroxy-4-carboxy-5-ureidoimidazoline decarboxylase n=1 Tax=Roseibium algae TaxID=3123038 RepID=A0ABU8TP38_9HYPH